MKSTDKKIKTVIRINRIVVHSKKCESTLTMHLDW